MIELSRINGRFAWQLVVLAIVVFCFALESVHCADEKSTIPFQKKFADNFPTIDQLSFSSLAMGEIKGQDLLGQAVLIVFFEPGCPGCIAKLPIVEEIRKQFASDGLTIVAMPSYGVGFENIVKQSGYDWIWAKTTNKIRPRLDAHRAFEIFLFDRTGKITYRFPTEDKDMKLHIQVALCAIFEKTMDFSQVPQDFVGAQSCGMCHPNELAQWENTPHSHAYQALVSSNNTKSEECHACHVTGERGPAKHPWQLVPMRLQEVGCEECHGPGGPHRSKPFADASLYSSREESCKRCHEPSLAGCSTTWEEPKWDYATSMQAVAHRVATPVSNVKTSGIPVQTATK